ncbi:hypothetical protein E2562_007134 [Oryza meyeriana var. granulata]|uniref:DNA polymerase delta subunit 4 n=1 Tax=Oryza meyeriana var. granulata TaxID=110450 RepID=A0A6G1CDQ8_9ORYZ|nr:hypothetical protein E2562_007134 [Oryza meyeriana var. granulata]
MAGGGVKGFYRQRKKAGVAKPKPSNKATKKKQLNCSQSQDCGDHGDAEEQQLRLFDMDMAYGPCIGITRLRRWERAAAMGLCPPARLRELLLQISPPAHPPSSSSSSSPATVQAECIWAGKVS